MKDIETVAYKTLILLKDYFLEFNTSNIQPNTVLLGSTYYNALKESFPEIVIGNKLLYNDKLLEICITKEDRVLGLAYSYHNEWK